MQLEDISTNLWYALVVERSQKKGLIHKLFAVLSTEYPHILSVVAERTCNLQCVHCIFQGEKSSAAISEHAALNTAVLRIAQRLPLGSSLVHEGRIFRPEHLTWLLAVRRSRPDLRIGMIDNGSYLLHSAKLHEAVFRFDWFDISLDGPELVHNLQRGNPKSYVQAIRGITEAHEYLLPAGQVHSLFTLTKVNFQHIETTAKSLPTEVGAWHITTLTPARPEIVRYGLNQDEFQTAWQSIVRANQFRPIHFRVYVAEDLAKLAQAVGYAAFCAAMENATVVPGAIQFVLDGVEVTFYPQSLSPTETFVIDADATYRAPYAIAFTLAELQHGMSKSGRNIQPYTNAYINQESEFQTLYQNGVRNWQKHFGIQALEKEKHIFSSILA